MEYYADAEGFIIAKDTDSYQKLEEIFGHVPAINTPFHFHSSDTDSLVFDLSNADETYWDDEVTDFLYRISEFICEGEVDYVGVDHELWRFIFDADTQQWREENGRVVYGEASPTGLSDEDLIKEIQKRGYTVQKVMLSDYINN